MKTQLMERSDISCKSEFDPSPFIYSGILDKGLQEN
jgi:hypothetical protein